MMNNLRALATIALIAIGTYFVIAKPVFIDPYLLRNNHRFTIGEIITIEAVAEGGPVATYIYNVNGKTYKRGANVTTQHEYTVGEKYFVMFYVKNPGNSDLLIDERTNRGTDNMPADGWLALPE